MRPQSLSMHIYTKVIYTGDSLIRLAAAAYYLSLFLPASPPQGKYKYIKIFLSLFLSSLSLEWVMGRYFLPSLSLFLSLFFATK